MEMWKWWMWTSAAEFGEKDNFYWDSTGALIGPHLKWAENEPSEWSNPELCLIMRHSGTYKWYTMDFFHLIPHIFVAKVHSVTVK